MVIYQLYRREQSPSLSHSSRSTWYRAQSWRPSQTSESTIYHEHLPCPLAVTLWRLLSTQLQDFHGFFPKPGKLQPFFFFLSDPGTLIMSHYSLFLSTQWDHPVPLVVQFVVALQTLAPTWRTNPKLLDAAQPGQTPKHGMLDSYLSVQQLCYTLLRCTKSSIEGSDWLLPFDSLWSFCEYNSTSKNISVLWRVSVKVFHTQILSWESITKTEYNIMASQVLLWLSLLLFIYDHWSTKWKLGNGVPESHRAHSNSCFWRMQQ